ncbi:unnamed protein product [Urochloa humidicola]
MEFATGALGTLLPKLGQLLQNEHNLQKGAKKNVEFLTRELESIHAALRKVGNMPPEQIDEQITIWARDVREESYDMEDMVDTFLVRVQGPDERPSKWSAKRFIEDMVGFATKAKIQRDINQEINDIKERVKEVAERRDRYQVDAITPTKTFDVDPRITSLYTKAADLVGIDEARDEVITRLSTQQRIVAVVGAGGLGKTTLAKAVYDKFKGQFDSMAFVPVGRNPDLKKVFKDTLIDLRADSNLEMLDERQLIDKLREFLKNKRYFIVFDDIWDTQSWGIIKLALIESKSGSRIIITTRQHEVAIEAGGVYKLQQLSDDNSRKLFFAKIFGGERKSFNHQMDEASDTISRKCDGIPLAIITMASLLVGKSMDEWSEVHRSIGLGNKEKEQVENTMRIISFRYYDLPSHLRSCLLYLSVFPEDYFIEKSSLIWMWIAEGFVHEKQGISPFEIGKGYFSELVNRSMIQLVEDEEVGNDIVCGCRVHDMVLDLIRSISSKENFVTILDNNQVAASSSQGRMRRLALQNNGIVEAHMDMQQVRSFISFGLDFDKGVPLSSFKHIRVLAIYCNFELIKRHHLKYLKNLLYLRYLRLSDIDHFPEEIGTLKFLQTLDLRTYWITNGAALPSVGLPTKLLCLRLRDPVWRLPDGIGKLKSLEELQISYKSDEEEPWRRFVMVLGSLSKLRVLRIGLPDLSTDLMIKVHMDMVESLRNLKKMEHLSLLNDGPIRRLTTLEAAGFLLPRQLGHLAISSIRLSRFPSFCINTSCLPNLSSLSLHVHDIDEQDLRIHLGGLPQLRFLELDVQSNKGLVCSTDAAGDEGDSFQKLRTCSMVYSIVRLLPSKDDTRGISLRMRDVRASMLLGNERKDAVCGGGKAAGVAPTLLPSVQDLEFELRVRELPYRNEDDIGRLFKYFASLQNASVDFNCRDASADEANQVRAALRRAVRAHPKRPRVTMTWSFLE